MKEIFVDYKEKYLVGDKGTIINKITKHKFKFIERGPYLCVCFRKDEYVHRVVYEAFKGKIPEGFVIDHINFNTHDNRLANLRAVPNEFNSRRKKNTRFLRLTVKGLVDFSFEGTIDEIGKQINMKYKALEGRVTRAVNKKQNSIKINDLTIEILN